MPQRLPRSSRSFGGGLRDDVLRGCLFVAFAARVPAQPREEIGHVRRERRLEPELPAVGRVTEGQAIRVQRLTRKFDRPRAIRIDEVAPLADERVSAQSGLQADLVALARLET